MNSMFFFQFNDANQLNTGIIHVKVYTVADPGHTYKSGIKYISSLVDGMKHVVLTEKLTKRKYVIK
jgi:hypothetical protein